MEEIYILHTNDLHSHFENWPRIRRYMKQRRSQLVKNEKDVFLFDLGDFSDRVHPLTEATDGVANVELMNQVQYDGITIGNNEGVGNSKDQLNHLYNGRNFDVILGNLRDKITGKIPSWCAPYKILTTRSGSKIGIIGLTAPFSLTYNPNGWEVDKVDDVLPSLIKELKGKVDLMILLSHLGLEEEKYIANNYPEIQVILGSHTHHLLPQGLKVNQSILAAAGRFGEYIGEVVIQIQRGRVVHANAQVVEVATLPVEPKDNEEINEYIDRGEQLLKENQIANISFPLLKDETSSHAMIKMSLEALKEYAKTDVAILNSGLFLQDIPVGIVNKYQLHQALPHPMHIMRVTLKGKELVRLIREMEKNRLFLRKFHIIGMGFRGKIFGDIIYDGVEYDKKTQKIFWLNKPIEEEKEYSLATVDHFLFIPFFPTIEIASKIEMLYPEFLRNVLARYLREHYS